MKRDRYLVSVPCVVMSAEYFDSMLPLRQRRIEKLLAYRDNLSRNNEHPGQRAKSARIIDIARRHLPGLFLVQCAGRRYRVSISVLVDWMSVKLIQPTDIKARAKRLRLQSSNTRRNTSYDRILGITEKSDVRRNAAALGIAQNLYRLAKADGDKDATRFALLWLHHADAITAVRFMYPGIPTYAARSFAGYAMTRYLDISELTRLRCSGRMSRQHKDAEPPKGFIGDPQRVETPKWWREKARA